MKRKIRRRCECGCNNITNYGKKWINGHCQKDRRRSKETKERLSLALMGNTCAAGNTNWLGKKHTIESKKKMSLVKSNMSEKTKRKMSLAAIGNKKGKGNKDKKRSDEAKIKMSLSKLKCNLNRPYCDAWRDKEYKDDIRKDYCENKDCKGNYKYLCNHHINLNKKDCKPINIITLCRSCHMTLHQKLSWQIAANLRDYIIINRPDHISYIHKKSRRKIRIERITNHA